MKFRKFLTISLISAATVLSGCGGKDEGENIVNPPETNIIENEQAIEVENTNNDEIIVENTTDEAENVEEDLSGLPYVEIKPILDLLDDVWGKNWLEWRPEDFIKQFDVVMPSEENYWTSPPGVGVKHAVIDSAESFSINEDGVYDSIYDAKSIGTYDTGTSIRRRYNRLLRFPGEMNEDSMSMYFGTCEGCISNDCSKCRNINCAGCDNDKCENVEIKECDDCLIKDCTDLLNYWGVDGPCEIATEYGKATLKIDEFEDSIYITINQFSNYKDLEILFTDGYGGATFDKFFISVDVEDKSFDKYADYNYVNNGNDDISTESPSEKVYNNPYAEFNEDDEAMINELRKFLKDNGIEPKFYSMYSTWKQLYNSNGAELTEQDWLNRFGQYLENDEF